MMSRHLERQLEKLKKMMLELGSMVEQRVEQATRAFVERDAKLAEQVIEGDCEVDEVEVAVEEECLHTLALDQPVAFDMRLVVAVLKINNDLERIADLAVNIAEQARFLSADTPMDAVPHDLSGMMQRVQAMLRQCLEALVKVDTDAAERVRCADDEVDSIHRQMYDRVTAAIQEKPEHVERYIHLLSVSRNLERMGDHAVNIAEDVLYMAEGKIIRHTRSHPLLGPRRTAEGS